MNSCYRQGVKRRIIENILDTQWFSNFTLDCVKLSGYDFSTIEASFLNKYHYSGYKFEECAQNEKCWTKAEKATSLWLQNSENEKYNNY